MIEFSFAELVVFAITSAILIDGLLVGALFIWHALVEYMDGTEE